MKNKFFSTFIVVCWQFFSKITVRIHKQIRPHLHDHTLNVRTYTHARSWRLISYNNNDARYVIMRTSKSRELYVYIYIYMSVYYYK